MSFHAVLQVNMIGGGNGPYSTMDGKKFLINAVSAPTDGGDPFTLITNWPGLLKK